MTDGGGNDKPLWPKFGKEVKINATQGNLHALTSPPPTPPQSQTKEFSSLNTIEIVMASLRQTILKNRDDFSFLLRDVVEFHQRYSRFY